MEKAMYEKKESFCGRYPFPKQAFRRLTAKNFKKLFQLSGLNTVRNFRVGHVTQICFEMMESANLLTKFLAT